MYGHAISDLINGKIHAVLGESSGTLFLKNQPLFQEVKIVGEPVEPPATTNKFAPYATPVKCIILLSCNT